ncbi:MAG: MATE family efflux transporter, partial [Bacteroidota bacterium]
LGLSSACFIACLEALQIYRSIFLLAVLKVACTFGLDSYFFGAYDFSLDIGVLGVAWSQVFIDLIMLIFSFVAVLNVGKITFVEFLKGPWFRDTRLFLELGAWSALESFIRNLAYLTMVLSLLNLIGPDAIAGYYLVIHLFWSFGLVPILAAGETTKALIGNHIHSKQAILKILKTALRIGVISIVVWIIATPFLSNILEFFHSNEQVLSFAKRSYYWLLLPYCLLAFNFILDAFLYGAGKTKYMALQAIFTHLIVYLPAFLLYQGKIWKADFEGVMLLIGAAILLDTILTLWYVSKTFTNLNPQ